MLPKKQRLSREHFQSPKGRSRSTQTAHLSARATFLHDKNEPSRFAVIVSAKISRSAVGRNKLRRRGYGLIEEFQGKTKSGLAVMIYYKKGGDTCSIDTLRLEMKELLQYIGVL